MPSAPSLDSAGASAGASPTRPSLAAAFALGFRPLFLLAALWGALALGLWGLRIAGWLPGPRVVDTFWHGHEMIFGFGGAVVVGFLFTAVRNWTGRPTPAGAALAVFVGTWLAARCASFFDPNPLWALDPIFYFASALAIMRPIAAERQLRNIRFPFYVAGLGAADVVHHLGAPTWGLWLGLAVILGLVAAVGGRVIPFFIRSRFGDEAPLRQVVWVERLAEPATVLAIALGNSVPSLAAAAAAGAAALLGATRLAGWSSRIAWREPMVAVLLASYGALVGGLALLAGTGAGFVPRTASLHLLTVGALSGMMFGMMPRVTRGHTGRPILADGATVALFGAIAAAAALRVAAAWAHQPALSPLLVGSALLWVAGALVFAVRFGPMLVSPRVDGRPG